MSVVTPPTNDEKEMSFVEHLDELRLHLIRMVIGICISAVFVFFATRTIFRYIIFGPLRDDFPTYQALCWFSGWLELGDKMCYDPVNVSLITLEMGEAFLLHIKVCLVGGLVLSFPYVLWELWRFIRPGLYA